jgi:anti-anti-sigma factor
MAVARPVELPVRWELSVHPDRTASLTFTGELDTVSTPVAWTGLEKELAGTDVSRLEVDLRQLASCDSAGLALLYYISMGRMTPGATVALTGLNPELQHLLASFSAEDLQALQNTSRFLHRLLTTSARRPGRG